MYNTKYLNKTKLLKYSPQAKPCGLPRKILIAEFRNTNTDFSRPAAAGGRNSRLTLLPSASSLSMKSVEGRPAFVGFAVPFAMGFRKCG